MTLQQAAAVADKRGIKSFKAYVIGFILSLLLTLISFMLVGWHVMSPAYLYLCLMLLAVMHRHSGISLHNEDVFINVVGGVKVQEPAVDLPILLATLSSFRDFILPRELVVFGEVGLAGEIRPVPNGQERLREAFKHGFKQAIIPATNMPKETVKGLEIFPISRLADAVDLVINKYK